MITRRAFSGSRPRVETEDENRQTNSVEGAQDGKPLPPGGESALVDLTEGFGEGSDFNFELEGDDGYEDPPVAFDLTEETNGYWPRNGNSAVSASSQSRIRVLVRKRPLNGKERARGEADILQVDEQSSELVVHAPRVKVDLTKVTELHTFSFDGVFDVNVSNDEVYEDAVEPLIPAILTGCRATVFAYGQTGSGKTYTMTPIPLRACQSLLSRIPQGVDVWCSYYEIYGGKVFDLLNERNLCPMREDGKKNVKIVGLREAQLQSYDHFCKLIDRGASARSTGSTGANADSSRSHGVLSMCIRASNGSGAAAVASRGKSQSGCLVDERHLRSDEVVGSVAFIDLAGSERGKDTSDNDVQTRMEGAEINRSLLALKECIRALDHKKGHVPFRGSKLTEALRDSFVGNSRTVMIAAVSPGDGSCEHTLNTLRYADRVRELGERDGSAGDGTERPTSSRPRVARVVHKWQDAATASLANGARERSDVNGSISRIGSHAIAETASAAPPAEELVAAHRRHVDELMSFMQQEMVLLQGVDDAPLEALDGPSYAASLREVLKAKSRSLRALQDRVEGYLAGSSKQHR